MSIPGSASPLFFQTAAAAETAAGPIKSVRFNSADSANLSRTFAAGNRKTFTLSWWMKRCVIDESNRRIFGRGLGSGSQFSIMHDSNGALYTYFDLNSPTDVSTQTFSPVYRDPSAWAHYVLAFDTTQSTDSDRIKFYFNGVQVTDFYGTPNWPTQDASFLWNEASVGYYIGGIGSYYINAYLADMYHVDGQQLDCTSFGAFDANGVWQAAAYTGTYGTNGFHLFDFANESGIGDDSSGNDNDWTVNNITLSAGGTPVASATGAKPIFATTDGFGQIVGTGLATDDDASDLELCAPLTDGSGAASMTDRTPTGRTSSALTLTNNSSSNITVNTSTGYFYGESLNFSGAHSGVDVAGIGIWNSNFTLEGWFRRTSTDQYQTLFDTWYGQTSGVGFYIWWDGTNIDLVKDSGTYYNNGSGTTLPLNTWQHIALTRNGTTIKIYVDGTEYSSFTPSDSTWTSSKLRIGDAVSNGHPFVGQIQDVRAYSGLKYTSNFTVPAEPATSPNDDVLFDVPTNGTQTDTGAGGEVSGNYCTWNALIPTTHTLTNGNLDASFASGSGNLLIGTIGVSSGKWYWELTINSGTVAMIGIAETDLSVGSQIYNQAGALYYYQIGGNLYGGLGKTSIVAAEAYGSAYTTGDVIGVALDMDSSPTTLVFYKNGVSQGTATNATMAGKVVGPAYGNGGGATNVSTNFGQRAFAYAAPSGYKALCTANLSTPTIADGSDYFDTKLYTGNGSTQTISGLEFSPDLVWIKSRSHTYDHLLLDQVRGAGNYLSSNTASQEALDSNSLTAFTSDGFSVGTTNAVNQNNTSLVAWVWDAGSSTVSNTDGSITSSVRANPAAGFSIITFTMPTVTTATIGHGLNAAPAFFVWKDKDSSANWYVYHSALGPDKYLFLDGTAASVTNTSIWNNTDPTNSVINTGNTFSNTGSTVVYAFTPVAGYSAFGKYTGNGLADGPFIYLGFRPAWIMYKAINESSAAADWFVRDYKRLGFNHATGASNNPELEANDSAIENNNGPVDILSNGFKIKSNNPGHNTSGQEYLYAAFAENPFQANGGLAR